MEAPIELPAALICWFKGKFDLPAISRLRRKIVEAGTAEVILDFSRVDAFDDATLALLTVNLVLLRRRGGTIVLRGLREQELGILRHFGIELATDGSVRLPLDDEAPFTD